MLVVPKDFIRRREFEYHYLMLFDRDFHDSQLVTAFDCF